MSNYKVGDRIKVTDHQVAGEENFGMLGTVREVVNGEGDWDGMLTIQLDNEPDDAFFGLFDPSEVAPA